MSNYPITSSSGAALLAHLPGYYESVRESRMLVQTEGEEFDQLRASLNSVFDQFFVGTATWGLSSWETEFGIRSPAGQPMDQRRSVIRSRIRGTGTVTVELLQNVAQSFDNGTIEVTETGGSYSFEVKFIDTLGVPPNLDDLKAAIEEIKPAHLEVVFSFRYMMLAEIEAMTLAQVESLTMDKIAWG